MIARFRSDRRGTTSIEYALMLGILAIALMAALPLFAGATGSLYGRIASAMSMSP